MICVRIDTGNKKYIRYNAYVGDRSCTISIEKTSTQKILALNRALEVVSKLFLVDFQIINTDCFCKNKEYSPDSKKALFITLHNCGDKKEITISAPDRMPNKCEINIIIPEEKAKDTCSYIKILSSLFGYKYKKIK